MSKLNIESTSEGSIAKFNGGQMIINEKENRCVIPPKASKEAKTIDFIILDGDKKKNEKQKSIL